MAQKQSNEQKLQQIARDFSEDIKVITLEEEKEKSDIPEEYSSDDYSQTSLHKGEEFEESFETGIAFSKK